MARQRQIIETVTCDVCGQETDDPTGVTLGWGREQWELDLCPTHNAELSRQFDTWTANGRRTASGARASGRRGGAGTTTGDANAIREWAKANGLQVGAKGRISADVRSAYESATKGR